MQIMLATHDLREIEKVILVTLLYNKMCFKKVLLKNEKKDLLLPSSKSVL